MFYTSLIPIDVTETSFRRYYKVDSAVLLFPDKSGPVRVINLLSNNTTTSFRLHIEINTFYY